MIVGGVKCWGYRRKTDILLFGSFIAEEVLSLLCLYFLFKCYINNNFLEEYNILLLNSTKTWAKTSYDVRDAVARFLLEILGLLNLASNRWIFAAC